MSYFLQSLGLGFVLAFMVKAVIDLWRNWK